MRNTGFRAVGGTVALGLVLGGCSGTPAGEPAAMTAVPTSSASIVSFVPCSDVPADAGSTHLDPPPDVTLTSPPEEGLPPLSGPLRVAHVATLDLPTGSILAGPGFDAVSAESGPGTGAVTLADHPVRAQVSAVLWEPDDDLRIAWLELSLDAAEPVTWETEVALDIVTDGGDGGFWSPTARGTPLDLSMVDDTFDGSEIPDLQPYLDALYPRDAPAPLCLLRATRGVEDGLVFPTGIGDGTYPTHVGRDATGRIVSVLHDGGMPWSSAGLPGTPPPDAL